MEQKRIKNIIEKLTSKEFHNEESIKFSILSMFASIPNFINCVPIAIEDIKYMLKGCNVFKYEIDKNENLISSIDNFKKRWKEILDANVILINNFSRMPELIIPLQALIAEENKNLFSVICMDEDSFVISKDYSIFEKFAVKTKIDYFSYMDKITRLVNEQNGEKLYLSIDESFSKEELRYEIKNVKKVNIPNNIMEALKIIYSKLEELNEKNDEYYSKINLSKERWLEIISILKASAHLNGRNKINLSDLFILKKVLWSQKSQILEINQIIFETINFILNKNCNNIKIYSAEMINLLVDMTRTFKLMKKEKNFYISNIDLIKWNSSFNRIKSKIIETKIYARDFFDENNDFLNLFIDEDDSQKFMNLFKIDNKLIFDWYKKLKTIINYVNENNYRN